MSAVRLFQSFQSGTYRFGGYRFGEPHKMPKLSNALPKYRKHRGSGQAVVTLRRRDYCLGPHGTKASKLEYDRLIDEWLSSGRSASFGASTSELSIAELLLAFLTYAKDYYARVPRASISTIGEWQDRSKNCTHQPLQRLSDSCSTRRCVNG